MTRALILNLFAIDLNNLDGGGANGGEVRVHIIYLFKNDQN